LEGSGIDLMKVLSLYSLGGTDENHETPVMIADVLAEN
jgi:hypothetical protein